MDERVEQMNTLKKAYLKQRRKAAWVWDVLFSVMLVLLIIAVVCLAYVLFYRLPLVRQLDALLWTPFKNLVGLTMNLYMVGRFVVLYGRYFVLGFLVLFVLVTILRSKAIARTRKLDSYLDYKTMKNTLKTEKQEAKR